MANTVLNVFPLRSTKGDVGIEIEVEGDRLPNDGQYNLIGDLWRVDRDGSLRGESFEYVLNKPIPIDMVDKAINVLKDTFEHHNSKVHDSIRAGVHVHVNVQKMTLVQLATFITAYLALEEILVDFCAPSRKGNHFCLRAVDAEYLLYRINYFFETGNTTLGDDIRYSAINMASLRKYGSLEFRCLETPQDFDKVGKWAKILYAIKTNSLEYHNPIEVIEGMSAEGFEFFLDSLLGEYADEFKKEGHEEKILIGIRNAQVIAYGTDWDSFDEKQLKATPVKKNSGLELEIDPMVYRTVRPSARPLRHGPAPDQRSYRDRAVERLLRSMPLREITMGMVDNLVEEMRAEDLDADANNYVVATAPSDPEWFTGGWTGTVIMDEATPAQQVDEDNNA